MNCSTQPKPECVSTREISLRSELLLEGKVIALCAFERELSRWVSFLAPQVKLRLDQKSDRCGHASSCRIGSLQSFRPLGLPTINTLHPAASCDWLLCWTFWDISALSIPKKISRENLSPHWVSSSSRLRWRLASLFILEICKSPRRLEVFLQQSKSNCRCEEKVCEG